MNDKEFLIETFKYSVERFNVFSGYRNVFICRIYKKLISLSISFYRFYFLAIYNVAAMSSDKKVLFGTQLIFKAGKGKAYNFLPKALARF